DGGAIGNNSAGGPAVLTVANCAFVANQAAGGAFDFTLGGAIANTFARLTVLGSLFVANQAVGGAGGGPAFGGAICNQFFSHLTLSNSTLTGNQCLGGNGGAGNLGGDAYGGGLMNVD